MDIAFRLGPISDMVVPLHRCTYICNLGLILTIHININFKNKCNALIQYSNSYSLGKRIQKVITYRMRYSLEKIILFSSAYVYKNLAMIFWYTQEANSPFYTSYVVLRRLVLYSERDTNRVWSMSVTDTRTFFLPSPGDIPPSA